jgi:hypothetical protein
MVHAIDLRPLSLRGRYAFALACIEHLCAAWAVDDPLVTAEVEAHWGALDARMACHWFDQHPFARSPEVFAAAVPPGRLSADQVDALHHALGEARMVVCGSCYAAASDEGSMQSVLNVVGVLSRWGVTLPSLERFRHATWAGDFGTNGWGERLGRGAFAG